MANRISRLSATKILFYPEHFALSGETSLLLLYFIGDFVEVSRGEIGPSIEKYGADAVDTGVLILSEVLRDERDRKLRGRSGNCSNRAGKTLQTW